MSSLPLLSRCLPESVALTGDVLKDQINENLTVRDLGCMKDDPELPSCNDPVTVLCSLLYVMLHCRGEE